MKLGELRLQILEPGFARRGAAVGLDRAFQRGVSALETDDVGIVVRVLLAQHGDLRAQFLELGFAFRAVVLLAGLGLQVGDLAAQALDVRMLLAVRADHAGEFRLQGHQAVLRIGDRAGGAQHRQVGLGLRQLALQRRLAFAHEGDLALQPLPIVEGALAAHLVGLRQVGRMALVLQLEVGQLLLEFRHVVADAHQLLVQERGRLGRLLLAVLDVLVEEQRGQLVGDLLRVAGHFAVVRQAERDRRLDGRAGAAIGHVRADRRDLDVAAHAVDDLLAGLALACLAVKPVLVDHVQQGRARHHLLADDLDALVGEAGHGGAHELLRDLLFLDQDRGGGAIDRRQRHRDDHGDKQQSAADAQREGAAAGEHGKVVAQGPSTVGREVAGGGMILEDGGHGDVQVLIG